MVERMEDRQGLDPWSRRNQIPSEATGSAVAARTHARTRGTPPASRFWYHARWIAINVAILAATAYVYAYHIIPRFQGVKSGSAGGDGRAAEITSGTPRNNGADITRPIDQERIRLGRTRQRADRRPATPALPRSAFADERTMRELGATCIAGMAVRREMIDGVPSYTPIAGESCREINGRYQNL